MNIKNKVFVKRHWDKDIEKYVIEEYKYYPIIFPKVFSGSKQWTEI